MGNSRSLASLLLLPSFILALGFRRSLFRGTSNPFPSKNRGFLPFPCGFLLSTRWHSPNCIFISIHKSYALAVFWDRVLALTGLQPHLEVLLLCPKCWDYRFATLCPANVREFYSFCHFKLLETRLWELNLLPLFSESLGRKMSVLSVSEV